MLECGFFIEKDHPYVGATPDGIVKCDCWGKGLLEIKCPFCLQQNNSCLPRNHCLCEVEGKMMLKKDHPYYYQIQTQLNVTKLPYCDFVLWGPDSLFVERVLPDQVFISLVMSQAKTFFQKCLLPELFGKFYTRSPVATWIRGEPSTSRVVTCTSTSGPQ